MKTITLTDQDGGKITGHLPEGWHEVPLSDFLQYHRTQDGKPQGFQSVALVSVLARLPTDALSSDVSLSPLISRQMPWVGQLPEPEPLPTFTHGAIAYEHVGNLDKVDAAQFEALLSFLEAAEANPIQAAPELLAVLYKPAGVVQDAETVAATAEAFRSLPISLAWPALAFFLTSSLPYANRIHSLSQSREAAANVLSTLEALAAAPSPRPLSRTAAALVRRYTRSVRAMLAKS